MMEWRGGLLGRARLIISYPPQHLMVMQSGECGGLLSVWIAAKGRVCWLGGRGVGGSGSKKAVPAVLLSSTGKNGKKK